MVSARSSPGGPERESQRQLVIFLVAVIVFVALGVLAGALTGSEPSAPARRATPTSTVQEQAP